MLSTPERLRSFLSQISGERAMPEQRYQPLGNQGGRTLRQRNTPGVEKRSNINVTDRGECMKLSKGEEDESSVL